MVLARSALIAAALFAPSALAQDGGADPSNDGTEARPIGPGQEGSSPALQAEPLDPDQEPDPDADPVTPKAGRNYVAVVVGISAYQNLPDATELNFGRSDAATVASALRHEAGFDEVFLLADGEASMESITSLLHTKVPQLVGPDDLFLFYFVGHGIGADLGLPVLLAHDSTLQSGQDDGFELNQLAQDLQTWIRAGSALIVTDVVHRNALDGISFFGPAATDWPTMPPNWMLLSASQSQRPGRDGAFGKIFADGISGAADANRDSFVTGAELHAYLLSRLSSQGQIPVSHGQFDPGMVVAQGVRSRPDTSDTTPAEPPKPERVLPTYTVSAAKFVWAGGAAQSVQCREKPVTTCTPSCYVRQFLAGPCKLKGIFEGVELEGEAMVLGPGKYDCSRKGGELVCTGP